MRIRKTIPKICTGCGKEFLARSTRSRYCAGACFVKKERAGSRARQARYTPERRAAYVAVHGALLRGGLIRQACEVCGVKNAHAHHDDYARPLDVRWLCRGHHRSHHNKFGPALNAYISEEV